ncbi:hypothetical protein Tco_0801512 [Tanacetum coccineum]|uniref:Uncharacterized protein n=1 Tax=Tanacetum coccineum TaxID=301880 RepID=A0ABQ4ZW65_9ASTR
MNHKTLIVPGTLDQTNHNDDDNDDEAATEMVTALTTAAMATVVAMMMEMTVASVRVVVVAMVKVVTMEMMLVAVVRRWRRWRCWRMRARGDGDGVAVIDQAVAWLSVVVTGMDFDASASKQPPVKKFLAWKTSNTREAPSSSSKQKSASPSEQPVDDVPIPDDMYLSESEDTGAAHLPKIKTRPDWLKPADALAKTYKDLEENKLLQKTGDMGSFIKWYCKQIGNLKLVKADLEGPAYKLVRPFHKNSISLQFQMEECHLLLTDQIDLVNPKGNRVMPDVSKPLPLGGLPAYGISHWWFKRKEFYITRHSAPSDRCAVKSHMRILSVVSLKTFFRYGYTYLREIVLRRADYKEYKISEADFKNLHPNDFEDMYLLHLQGKLNHLSGADKVHLFNAVNLWIRNIVIRQRVEDLQLEDYTIIRKPRAVIYRDRYNKKKMMQESEVHKFSDGTLTRILEKLDHMVKYYELFKFNPGMEHIIWSEDDKQRSQEFIKLIERRLKIRSLKSFVSGRLRDVDYRLIQITE